MQDEKPKPEMMKQKVGNDNTERPSESEPFHKLKVTVTPSLQKALDKCLQQMSLKPDDTSGNCLRFHTYSFTYQINSVLCKYVVFMQLQKFFFILFIASVLLL